MFNNINDDDSDPHEYFRNHRVQRSLKTPETISINMHCFKLIDSYNLLHSRLAETKQIIINTFQLRTNQRNDWINYIFEYLGDEEHQRKLLLHKIMYGYTSIGSKRIRIYFYINTIIYRQLEMGNQTNLKLYKSFTTVER